jgi:hypothetical protein
MCDVLLSPGVNPTAVKYKNHISHRKKPVHSETTRRTVTWFTTNPTWIALGAIPGLVVGSRRLNAPDIARSSVLLRFSLVLKRKDERNFPPETPQWLCPNIKKIRLCFSHVRYLLNTNYQPKNKARIPRSPEPLCSSKVYHCLLANNNEKQIFQHHTSPNELWA